MICPGFWLKQMAVPNPNVETPGSSRLGKTLIMYPRSCWVGGLVKPNPLASPASPVDRSGGGSGLEGPHAPDEIRAGEWFEGM